MMNSGASVSVVPLSTYTRHRAMLPEQLFLLDLGASALFLLALKAM